MDVFTVGLKFRYPSSIAAKNNWYVDFMQVYDLQPTSGEPKTFACYHWIGQGTNEVSCTSRNGELNIIACIDNDANYYVIMHTVIVLVRLSL